MNGKTMKNGFQLEVLADFLDDALCSEPITPEHIDSIMQHLRELNINRISWSYYADDRGGFLMPGSDTQATPSTQEYKNCVETYRNTLQNPIRQVVEIAHKHGIEVYAYFKPYETGIGLCFPKGSPEAKKFGRLDRIGSRIPVMDPFVAANPDLRIKRRCDDTPASNATATIATIKLFKSDDSPTRITKDDLEIWACEENFQYKKLDVDFTFEQSIQTAACDIYDVDSQLLTAKGAKVRCLTIGGLELNEKYILVTTKFKDDKGGFVNTSEEMVRAYDSDGCEIICSYADGSAIWCAGMVDFRNWGLMFDHGYGKWLGTLDNDNRSGKCGVIALTRGRNEYLDGALCETEPKVQQFWLDNIRKLLAMGVDGIEFRIENHSSMTQYPQDYGYNQVILDKLSDPENPAPQEIAKVRGDAYTEFLQQAKSLVDAKNRKMRINLQMDFYRPAVLEWRKCAYPGNVDFQWQQWVDLGLMHQAVFRYYAYTLDEIIDDEYAAAITEYCMEKDIPVTFNRYVRGVDVPEFLPRDLMRVYEDGRFSGFIFYELVHIFKYNSDSTVSIKMPEFLEAINLFCSNTSHIS